MAIMPLPSLQLRRRSVLRQAAEIGHCLPHGPRDRTLIGAMGLHLAHDIGDGVMIVPASGLRRLLGIDSGRLCNQRS